MKRIIPLLFCMLFLSACSVKEYTPILPSAFTQNARVSMGDFSYDCIICKNESDVEIEITSTSARGMKMLCDGDKIKFSFEGIDYEYPAHSFNNYNAAIIIYEVFSVISSHSCTASKLEQGYSYQGKISAGDFVLTQNDDSSFNTLSVKNSDILIEFK